VLGLGLLGLLTCQILRAQGCRVIGFDFDGHKVSMARSFGAMALELGEGIDPVEAALSFSKGPGVDGVIITAATKSDEPMHQAPQMCRTRGRVVLVGVVGLHLSRDDFFKKEISFQVSCSYGPGRYQEAYEKRGLDYPIGYVRWTEQRNFEAILQLMADGLIRTGELVSDRIPIDRAREAYDKVLSGGDLLGIMLEYPRAERDDRRIVPLLPAHAVRRVSGKMVAGFIGAGNFASSTLVPAFAACGVRLKTIVSSGGVSGHHVGKKSGFEMNGTDMSMVYDDKEITTIVISTPHNSHGRLVLEALRAGKHVFVEKPLCLAREEMDEIGAFMASTAGAPLLMVGFNRRFAPLTVKVKQMIAPLAEPAAFIMTVNAGAIPADHWTQSPETGGGRIIGEGCHFLDLLRFLAESPFDGISAFHLGGQGVLPVTSDKTTIVCSFSNGSLGTVHYLANGHKSFPKERLEVFCAGRVLQIDNFRALSCYGGKGASDEKLFSQDKGHRGCVKAFVEAVEKGVPSPIPFGELAEVADFTFRAAGI
jgi:predicted dehydrogenase